MVLLLYVDDIILTGKYQFPISSLIATLDKEFELKDLRPLCFFLDLEATPLSIGIHLFQTKYMLDLLRRSKMSDCHPYSTPVSAKSLLSTHDGTPLVEAMVYR